MSDDLKATIELLRIENKELRDKLNDCKKELFHATNILAGEE